MKKNLILLIASISFIFSSCSKEEGYGGLATITGKVYAKNYNSNGNLVSEGYIGEYNVYISKHNDPNHFDSVDSSYDGSYRFEFLHEGTYDVWVFGDCDSCPWDQVYDLKTISITSKKQTVVVEDLNITY